MGRTLQNIRSSTMSQPPQNADEIKAVFLQLEFFEEFGRSKHDEKRDFFKVAFSCNEFQYCIFASDTIIDQMREMPDRTILMDATFKVVPCGEFKQLLIIYVGYLNKVCICQIL